MRVLVTAVGSRGDVQPVLALARALRARGHEIMVGAPNDFAAWATELELPFVSSGENVQQWLHEHWKEVNGSPAAFLRVLKSIALDMVPRWFEATMEAARDVDVIVSANQIAARTVAEKLRIPCLSIAYSPLWLPSAYHPPLFVRWQRLPRWLNAALSSWQNSLVWNVLARRYVNRERAKLDLPALTSVTDHLYKGMPYLLACDPVLAPLPPDWSSYDVTPTGPWFYDDPIPLDPEVEAFLDSGPPPVYVGFGSMVSSDAARLTRAILEGAGARGRRLLMSKGWAGIGGGKLPSSVKVVHGPMPHAKLFPRVAAVVHHCGAGTTATALRAGVPQVVVPHMADQFHHAHRLAVLGLAPPGIPINRMTARRLAGAVEATLALPSGPREAAAARLRDGDGLDRAIAIIERTPRKAPEPRGLTQVGPAVDVPILAGDIARARSGEESHHTGDIIR